MNLPGQVLSILILTVIVTIALVGYILTGDEIINKQQEDTENNEPPTPEEYDGYSEFWEDDKALYDEPISKAGDPLLIEDSPISIIHDLEPQHYCLIPELPCWDIEGHAYQNNLFYFDFNCDGKNQPGDRNPAGTLTLYIDYDKNERITNGCEAMWSYSTPAHIILSEKDSNGDGIISPQDDIWPKLRMTDWDVSYTPEQLGYQYFDLTGYVTLQHDDCHGFIGTYADGASGYIKDEKYHQCIQQGWSPIEPITKNHLRVVGYNDCGGYQDDQGCVRIYSGVLGYWENVT